MGEVRSGKWPIVSLKLEQYNVKRCIFNKFHIFSSVCNIFSRRSDSPSLYGGGKRRKPNPHNMPVSQPTCSDRQPFFENRAFCKSQPKLFVQENDEQTRAIFNNLCRRFLISASVNIDLPPTPCPNGNCQGAHILPTSELLLARLKVLSPDTVRAIILNYVKVYKVLMVKYFHVFCTYFAEKKLKTDLLQMVSICDDRTYATNWKWRLYVPCILMGMVAAGARYSIALNLILKTLKRCPVGQIRYLFHIITDPLNDDLIFFEKEMEAIVGELLRSSLPPARRTYTADMVVRFLAILTNSRSRISPKLLNLGLQLTNPLPLEEVQKIDQTLLIRFVELHSASAVRL